MERHRRYIRWATPVGVVLLILAIAVAGAAAIGSPGHSAGDPPSGSPATTSAATAPLPATKLAALPDSVITNGTAPLAVTLSAPPSPGSPTPMLEPHVAGSWSIVQNSEVFTPVSTLQPCSDYKLTVWAQTTSIDHAPLGHRRTLSMRVVCPPLAAMQQALARLGYLGATFRPQFIFHAKHGRETRREAAEHAFRPPRGRLAPDPYDAPPVQMGRLDPTTRGALEVYQNDHGLQASGEPDSATWASVLASLTDNRRDRQPYTWASVSEALPESLTLHQGHHVVLSTPVNTGVAGAETEQGIFPIYSRLVSTTMSGTDPDGVKYSVPDVPWVNYFNGGDAVHGYPRESYGFPQSNGCVELPIETAHRVFGYLAIGDIVWVR